MDIDKTIHSLSQKIADIEDAYTKLNESLFSMEEDLNSSLRNECALNDKLKEALSKKRSQNGKHATPSISVGGAAQQPTTEPVVDQNAQMEKLLQGTLDVLGDKISDRLMAMLKDLKSLPVEMRTARIQEVKQAADAELVDLSGLYKHQEIQSNIEDVGVTETEAKGIDKNLEKLRKLRQMRLNP
ncbi:MAG: hypothetical protein HQL15_02950 [Candidatus Omnitrophica bacterium]|nr:hypothetical protein [Candidatus Omnitrophota bacterium]